MQKKLLLLLSVLHLKNCNSSQPPFTYQSPEEYDKKSLTKHWAKQNFEAFIKSLNTTPQLPPSYHVLVPLTKFKTEKKVKIP